MVRWPVHSGERDREPEGRTRPSEKPGRVGVSLSSYASLRRSASAPTARTMTAAPAGTNGVWLWVAPYPPPVAGATVGLVFAGAVLAAGAAVVPATAAIVPQET